jgi:hypothetical protein
VAEDWAFATLMSMGLFEMSQVATLEGSPGFQGADFTKKDAQNAGISWGFHGDFMGK